MSAASSHLASSCARYATIERDTGVALAGLHASVPPDAVVTFVFVSPTQDLAAVEATLRDLPGLAVGCTSSGEIGDHGLQTGGLTAMSLGPALIDVAATWSFDLATLEGLDTLAVGVDALHLAHPDAESVGILLLDGLSRREEQATAAVYASLPGVPIIGASAGDDLRFERTSVFDGDHFTSGRGVFTLLMSRAPLVTFRFHHHEATDVRMVVTRADVDTRLVFEINGHPARDAYARAVGLRPEDLVEAAEASALFPLMVRVGKEHLLRSIQGFGADGSIRFYCAIEAGTVLAVGRPSRLVERMRAQLERVATETSPPAALLVFDCVLRRLEYEHSGLSGPVGRLLASYGAIGFSTYGEQYGPLHINQTLVGLAIGEAPR